MHNKENYWYHVLEESINECLFIDLNEMPYFLMGIEAVIEATVKDKVQQQRLKDHLMFLENKMLGDDIARLLR